MKQTIRISDLPPMMNGRNGIKRMHWSKYCKIRDKWHWLILAEKPQKHSGKVSIMFIRKSVRAADLDNVASGFKCIGDGLVKMGVIKDDSPDIVVELRTRWEKARQRSDQKTIIIIEDYEPGI